MGFAGSLRECCDAEETVKLETLAPLADILVKLYHISVDNVILLGLCSKVEG
jgi:hypothetical protein